MADFYQQAIDVCNYLFNKKKQNLRARTSLFFLIFGGTSQSPRKVCLAADKQIICSFEASLVESALALLATYYLFMYNYPPGLANFFLSAKVYFANKGWQKATMLPYARMKFIKCQCSIFDMNKV